MDPFMLIDPLLPHNPVEFHRSAGFGVNAALEFSLDGCLSASPILSHLSSTETKSAHLSCCVAMFVFVL